LELVSQLIPLLSDKGNIIVVDSSDNKNEVLINKENVSYIRSSHKNQPYQRYLGYLATDANVLFFFDDDMEVEDEQFIDKILAMFQQDAKLSGIAVKFKNKHENTSIAKIPNSKIKIKNNALKKFKNWFTGYPQLPDGAFGYCGNKGKQPIGGGKTNWVWGPSFVFKHSAAFKNFNFQLLDMFEEKLGMGEDAILGYGASKDGYLKFHDELFLIHNDQNNSTYTSNFKTYAKRVAFSRYYLSKEKARLDKANTIFPILHYIWYMHWRILGYFFNYIIRPNKSRKEMLSGFVNGFLLTFTYKWKSFSASETYWKKEAQTDLHKNKSKYE